MNTSPSQPNRTSPNLEKLNNESWGALTNEQNPAKVENLIRQIDDVLEQKLVGGNEVLVWQERRNSLAERHCILSQTQQWAE